MKGIILKVLKWLGIILGALIGCFVLLILVLTVFAYRPKAVQDIALKGNASGQVEIGKPMTILTWNIGYGALGDNADFFMDGGTMVNTASKNRVNQNMAALCEQSASYNPDFVFLQEVDTKAKRSWRVNERKCFAEQFPEFQNSFAYNFKVLWSPVPGLFYAPVPGIFVGNAATMGNINCGIMSLAFANAKSSTRVRLPCPFSWPLSIVNLKRCLMVNRYPIEGSDKELVMVNLHLEAYDSGEGKIAQTKMLRDIFDSEVAKGNYVIAGGDFNQTFSNVDMSKYPVYEKMWAPGIIDVSDFSEGTQFVMDSSNPSCRSLDKVLAGADLENFQFYIIDGFIVSPNVQVNSVKTQNRGFVNTDHNPVVMNFTLK